MFASIEVVLITSGPLVVTFHRDIELSCALTHADVTDEYFDVTFPPDVPQPFGSNLHPVVV